MLERGAAAAGAEIEGIVLDADIGGLHYFVSEAVFEQAVLVNARGMGKGIAADNSLIGLHRHAHEARNEAAGGINFRGIEVGMGGEILAGFEDHGDFFERSIARALADAVNGDLHLPGAILDGSYGVGGGHTEIIVAMHGNYRLVDIIHVLFQVADLGAEFIGGAVAGGVGDIDVAGARSDHGLDHLSEIGIVGPAGVFGVKFDFLDKFPGVLDGRDTAGQNIFAGGVKFVLNVDI